MLSIDNRDSVWVDVEGEEKIKGEIPILNDFIDPSPIFKTFTLKTPPSTLTIEN
jgi:hypothetical protein